MTITEENFLKENYPIYGPKYCALKLNSNEDAIYQKANRLGLKKIGHTKHPSMQKINPEQFWKIERPEIVYILGYLWADGYIDYRINKTSHCYKISLEIQEEDAKNIEFIMDSIGVWSKYYRKPRKSTWKATVTFSTNSKDIYEFLKDNGYDEKSDIEPTQILSKIPENLKHYFWRGFYDGDGSLHFNGKVKSLQYSSTYNYEWTELLKLFKELEINKYNLHRKISKENHRASKITIFRHDGIVKMCNYLLMSELGLTRKTNKILEYKTRD